MKKAPHMRGFLMVTASAFVAGLMMSGAVPLVLQRPAIL